MKHNSSNLIAIKRLVLEIKINACPFCIKLLPKIKDNSLKELVTSHLNQIVNNEKIKREYPQIFVYSVTNLYKIDSNQRKYIELLVSNLEFCGENTSQVIAEELLEILREDDYGWIISKLKPYLSLSKKSPIYENCFHIVWHCVQRINYTDFYNAWHGE